MKRKLKTLLGVLALGGMLMLSPSEPEAPTCYEDEPCWDCETMGNLICGKDLK